MWGECSDDVLDRDPCGQRCLLVAVKGTCGVGVEKLSWPKMQVDAM